MVESNLMSVSSPTCIISFSYISLFKVKTAFSKNPPCSVKRNNRINYNAFCTSVINYCSWMRKPSSHLGRDHITLQAFCVQTECFCCRREARKLNACRENWMIPNTTPKAARPFASPPRRLLAVLAIAGPSVSSLGVAPPCTDTNKQVWRLCSGIALWFVDRMTVKNLTNQWEV